MMHGGTRGGGDGDGGRGDGGGDDDDELLEHTHPQTSPNRLNTTPYRTF